METGPAPEGRPRRIGIFGGTFDPPHVGHVQVARDVADALDLDRLLWVPAGMPPHKRDASPSPAPVRLAMVRAAAPADPRFEVSALEVERDGPSFTVDTLRALRAELPDAELFVVLGADQYRAFDAWREPDEILRLARLAVMDREGAAAASIRPEAVERVGAERVTHVPVRRVDVSSSDVRAARRSGEDVSDRVPETVLRIVEAHRLYAADTPGGASRRAR